MANTQRYNAVAIALHWLMAALILFMLGLGLLMEDLPASIKFSAYTIHKSVGITVLALSVFRLVWRFLNPPPALPTTMKLHEKILAHAAHWGLYVLMVGMPLSGWLMVSAMRKYPTDFFWLFEVPFLPMPQGIDPKATKEWFEEVHELLAYGAIALIILHVAAALKHQFVDKDNLLARMKPRCGSCSKRDA